MKYFVPFLRQPPLPGRSTAEKRLLTLAVFPSFVDEGINNGPTITIHMLMGTTARRFILSPLVKNKSKAPGNVASWEYGSRGCIVGLSQAALLVNSDVKLAWFLIRLL